MVTNIWRGNSKFSDYRRADTVYVWNTKKVEWRERNEVKVDNFWCNAKATRPGLNIEYPGTKPAYFIFPFSFFFKKKKRRLIFEKVNSFFPLSQLYNSSFFPSHLLIKFSPVTKTLLGEKFSNINRKPVIFQFYPNLIIRELPKILSSLKQPL